MPLKITTQTTEVTIVKLAGRLSGSETNDLLRLCSQLEGPLVLDLSGLQFADDEGIRTLLGLRDSGAELHEARPYLAAMLKELTEDN